jgi:hypothetical protein
MRLRASRAASSSNRGGPRLRRCRRGTARALRSFRKICEPRPGTRSGSASSLSRVDPSDDVPRTTRLLAERWASRFCTIQQLKSRGEALKFFGAFLAAGAWIAFVLLAKGTTDFQASDLLVPGVATVIAMLIAAIGFVRERRAARELQEATARLARELDTRPSMQPWHETGQQPPEEEQHPEQQQPSADPRWS